MGDRVTHTHTPFVKVVRSGARDENGALPPEVWREEEVAPTLNAFDNGSESRATVLAFTQNQRDEVRDLGDRAGALPTEPGMHQQTFVATAGVRRLTPRECERLQGFPDDWTRWGSGPDGGGAKVRYDGDTEFEIPDSARYRMMGNAVAVPCAEWIGRQLLAALSVQEPQTQGDAR